MFFFFIPEANCDEVKYIPELFSTGLLCSCRKMSSDPSGQDIYQTWCQRQNYGRSVCFNLDWLTLKYNYYYLCILFYFLLHLRIVSHFYCVFTTSTSVTCTYLLELIVLHGCKHFPAVFIQHISFPSRCFIYGTSTIVTSLSC